MRKLISYGPSIVVLCTAVLVLAASPSAIHTLTHAHTMARVTQAAKGLEHDNILEEINQAYRNIATAVEPSVVHISASRGNAEGQGRTNTRSSSGSGWIYDEQGHIVTNFHVVEGADRIDVQLYNGEIRSATMIGADPTTDIAVLRISPERLHPAVRVESGREIKRGDKVFAFGSPFDFRFSVSAGIVSGMGRSVGVIRVPLGFGTGYENFIQVDAAINPGNSGGPLTDFRGHVIGMNTAIATSARRERGEEGQFSGIGLAIPIDMIEPVVTQLIETGEVRKGYLGISVINRLDRIADEYAELGYRRGGVIVAHHGNTQETVRAELRHGDVIAQINGHAIRSREDLLVAVRDLDLNGDVELTVWRYDHERYRGGYLWPKLPADLVISELPEMEFVQFDEAISTRLNYLGFQRNGVVVGPVQPDAPARHAGLRQGDVITHVDGRAVTELTQLQARISSMMPGDEAHLTLWRFDSQRNVSDIKEFTVPLARLETVQTLGFRPPMPARDAIERLGIVRMETMTDELASSLDIEMQSGVLIRELEPEGEIARQIQPGSIIVSVQDTQIESVDELLEALNQANLNLGARVGVINPDKSFSVVTFRAR